VEARTGLETTHHRRLPAFFSQEANMLMGGVGEKILIIAGIISGILIWWDELSPLFCRFSQ
jgi:hypothetical protein